MKVIHSLADREIGTATRPYSISQYFEEDELIDNLKNTETLSGHSGCVNTLRWNKSGSILASGSDDRTIRLWKGGAATHKIATNHMGNVFAVEFLPAKHDEVIVSGAADHMVMMHHIESGQYAQWQTDGRVKRMFTTEADPFLFWAASEDGILREFDSRTEAINNLVTFIRCPIKSAAIAENKPYLIAIGLERGDVPIYDRRKPDKPVISLCPLDPNVKTVYTTHVAFNKNGTECIVNQGGGGVLIYDLNEAKSPQIISDFENILQMSRGNQVDPIDINSLGFDELRLRGSDYIQGKMFLKAIDYYGSLQKKKEYDVAALRSIFYSNRGLAFLCRRERGDSYACLRECIQALFIHPGNKKALWRLCKAFIALEQWDYATQCISEYKTRFPSCQLIQRLEKEISTAEVRQVKMKKKVGSVDYKERYTGHVNYQTDIKEANFFGTREQYIVAGSDCGSIYIYSREKNSLIGIWKTDDRIVNIIQPHPDLFLLAASGIDDDIRLWSPSDSEPIPRYKDLDDDDNEEERLPYARIANPYEYIAERQWGSVTRMQMNMAAHSVIQNHPECLTS